MINLSTLCYPLYSVKVSVSWSRSTGLRVLPLLLLTAVLAGCFSRPPDAQQSLRDGKAALQQGDVDRARVFAKNAVQANPKLVDAYLLLAEIDSRGSKWNAMLINLLNAIKVDPNHPQAHVKLGELYLLDKQYDKALDESATVLKVDPENSGATVLLGAVSLHQGKPADAMIQAEKVLVKDPNNIDALALKARVLAGEHRYADAVAALDLGTSRHPDDANLQLLKIAVKEQSGDKAGAVIDYSKLVQRNPQRTDLKNGLVALMVRAGQLQAAEDFLRTAIREDGGRVDLKVKLLELLTQRDPAAAEQAAKEFTTAYPDQIPLRLVLADIYLTQKRYDEAKALLNETLAGKTLDKNLVAVRVKLATVAMTQKDMPGADHWLTEALQTDPNNRDALLQRAMLRLGRHEAEGAISDLRLVLRDHPELDTALILLAQAHLQLGASELAESQFWKALEANPSNPAAAFPVAASLVQRRDLDRAEEILNGVLRAKPEDRSALELVAQLKVLRNDLQGARSAVSELAKNSDSAPVANYISGLIFERQGHHDEAILKFQQALEERPNQIDALHGLARSYNALNKRDALVTFLAEFIKKHPEVTDARTTLGLVHGIEKRWLQAEKVLQEAIQHDATSVSAYAILANVYHQQGRFKDAGATYQRGLEKQPDSVPLLLGLAEHFERENDIDMAMATYQTLIDKAPTTDRAANNLAVLIADHRPDAASLVRARALVERFGSSAQAPQLDTYGWVALKAGEREKAINVLGKAVKTAPEVPLYHYHLGVANFELGNRDAAQLEFKKAIDLAPSQGDFPGLDSATELLRELAVSTAH
jgi:tetratricopeptide (TPR) repeat protein